MNYIKEKKPTLLNIQYDALDHVGHAAGHDTPAYYNKLEEIDTSLPVTLWEQMRTDVTMAAAVEEADIRTLPAVKQRKRMFLRDFVEKAVNHPIHVYPEVPEETIRQLYRLHLFCCQRAIHNIEVKRNPFQLGFVALREMKTALMGMLISYRLIDPSCPYSWNHDFFEMNIITDKNADGDTVIKFNRIPPQIIPLAVTEELVTDWLIYRAYDNNGIRTLMDYKNNLLTLPDYQRGGAPENEFSRFERKMQEQRNRVERHKNQELDLEFRKTLVRNVAQQTANEMINSGLSASEILEQAFKADLSKLVINKPQPRYNEMNYNSFPKPQNHQASNERLTPQNKPWLDSVAEQEYIENRQPQKLQALPAPESNKQTKPKTPVKHEDTSMVDEMIAKFLDED